jgi:hypothetical protein
VLAGCLINDRLLTFTCPFFSLPSRPSLPSPIPIFTVHNSTLCMRSYSQLLSSNLLSLFSPSFSSLSPISASSLWADKTTINYVINSMELIPSKDLITFSLVKKFAQFYGTRWFITLLTTAIDSFFPWDSWVQLTFTQSMSLRSILILSPHRHLHILLKYETLTFYCKKIFVTPRLTKMENYLLSAVRDFLQYIPSWPSYLEAVFSTCNMRRRHVVETATQSTE